LDGDEGWRLTEVGKNREKRQRSATLPYSRKEGTVGVLGRPMGRY